MPEICRFLGITIYLYYKDHPPAHFHAEYGEYTITVEIETGIVSGRFPRRALNLVLEWYAARQGELRENWALAQQRRPLKKIAPLE